MVQVDYDPESDSLYLYNEKEKAKHSVEFQENFVIDFGFGDDVVGLEVLNAAKSLGVSKGELKGIKEAKLSVLTSKGKSPADILFNKAR